MQSRLSLAKCRHILGSPDLPDELIEKLRDELYLFAQIVVDSWSSSPRTLELQEDEPSNNPKPAETEPSANDRLHKSAAA